MRRLPESARIASAAGRPETSSPPRPGVGVQGVNSVVNLRLLFSRHPILISWAVLAVGMVVMLLYAAKDVSLLPTQIAALIVATILLAGACVWILTWD